MTPKSELTMFCLCGDTNRHQSASNEPLMINIGRYLLVDVACRDWRRKKERKKGEDHAKVVYFTILPKRPLAPDWHQKWHVPSYGRGNQNCQVWCWLVHWCVLCEVVKMAPSPLNATWPITLPLLYRAWSDYSPSSLYSFRLQWSNKPPPYGVRGNQIVMAHTLLTGKMN